MSEVFEQEITYLKGVGPKRAELLNKELGIYTYYDLLYYFPFRYIDKTRIYKIREIKSAGVYVQTKGKFRNFRTEGSKYKPRLIAEFADDTDSIEIVWFQGIKWIQKNYDLDTEYIIFGKPTVYKRKITFAHPEIEPVTDHYSERNLLFQPQYGTTEKLKNNYINSKTIQKLVYTLLSINSEYIHETLPEYLIKKNHFLSLKESLVNIHFPVNNELIEKARYRLKFEELFFIQLNILKQKYSHQKVLHGFIFTKVGKHFNDFYNRNLKFELTNAQKRVLKEIRKDLGSGKHMNRLLQGDVGSGKTIVALMSMLIAIDNNYQTSIMAPTEILANQHYNTICELVRGLNIQVELLTGSTKKTEREKILEDLHKGELKILIGTHALLEDPVIFKNLGLVIIDEQHRFGVAQRAKLWRKNEHPPHVLVMTATPIPRTLAMTLYGDLDVSVIDEMPPGRKQVKTYHYFDNKRLAMFGFLRKQTEQNHQIYIVYPLIKESESLDYKDLEDGYAGIVQAFPPPEYTVSCVHGKMKTTEKEIAMDHFVNGRSQILVATTVIEVGVDIPNATIMVIESAERFGLSQLHQLRGRVGRGADQSYCILMTSHKLSNEAKKRIEVMTRTNDGFEIAEADLKLRGPGDIEGTQQSGIPFELKIADLGKDGQILQYARNIAEKIIEKDPELRNPENILLINGINKMKKQRFDWSLIS